MGKKHGGYRFCVDYRLLNSQCIFDAYSLPLINDSLQNLASHGSLKFMSSMDLQQGYMQVEMHPDSKERTAFCSRRGLFQFTRMPFGLRNAPALFQRLMEYVLRGLQFTSCLVYLDDILVFSSSLKAHIHDLECVFDRLRSAGLKLKSSKCFFAKREITYLGHKISAEGIKVDPEKTKAVEEYPVPTNVTETRAYLGLT